MSRRMTISRWPSSNSVFSSSRGSWPIPRKSSAYISATRPGVPRRPSRWGSSPMARMSSRTAFSILAPSTLLFLELLAVNKAQGLGGGAHIPVRPHIQGGGDLVQVQELITGEDALLYVDGHYLAHKPVMVPIGVVGH